MLCVLFSYLLVLTLLEGQDTVCAYVRSFPMVEVLQVAEGGDGFGMQLLDSLCKAKPSLRIITVFSGSVFLKWTADGHSL